MPTATRRACAPGRAATGEHPGLCRQRLRIASPGGPDRAASQGGSRGRIDEDRLTGAYDGRTEDQSVIEWAFARCSSAMAEAAAAEPAIVVHGDLHGGNLKWHEGRLAVFDFDDCGVAVRTLDLAISTFYLRKGSEEVEEALRRGYSSVLDLPDLDPGSFEALVASRQLLLANDLLRTSNAELKELADEYLDRTMTRLRRWQEIGRFTL